MNKCSLLLVLAMSVAACGRPATPADVKMVGVGNNPEEIGPAPEEFGGLIEYDYMDLAGGALSIGAFGFTSYEEVNPAFMSFRPPYALIYGLAFIFQDRVARPDMHHGSVGVPPTLPDTCWTNKDPMAFLGARTVDVGDGVGFVATEEEMGAPIADFGMDRVPEEYPPDMQDVFVYYQGIESWVAEPLTSLVRGATDDPMDMTEKVVRPSNFVAGSTMNFSFPGGISPAEAPVSSIPLPSAAGAGEIVMPALPGSVLLSWDGPLWDSTGAQLAEGGEQNSCMRYLAGDVAPESVEDCDAEVAIGNESPNVPGQIYTGPWDTADGTVTFNWEPGLEGDGEVILNVRFLGPVDPTNENFVVEKVSVAPEDAPQRMHNQWENALEEGTVTGDLPDGFRDPLPCEDEEEIDYVFDPSLGRVDDEGNLVEVVPALQGDPGKNVAEVSCLLEDDGEFVLDMDMLGNAFSYAESRDAEGALFYFGRVNSAEMTVPAVRDQQGARRDITPVMLRSHAMKIGRFWFDQD